MKKKPIDNIFFFCQAKADFFYIYYAVPLIISIIHDIMIKILSKFVLLFLLSTSIIVSVVIDSVNAKIIIIHENIFRFYILAISYTSHSLKSACGHTVRSHIKQLSDLLSCYIRI